MKIPVKLIGVYANSKEMKHLCLIHGREFYSTKGRIWLIHQRYQGEYGYQVTKSSGETSVETCRFCNPIEKPPRKLSAKEVRKMLKKRHGNLVQLIHYGGTVSRNAEFCCIRGHRWTGCCNNVLNGTGCYQCYKEDHIYTAERVKEELSQLYNGSLVLVKFSGDIQLHKSIFRCDKGHTLKVLVMVALGYKSGCPVCRRLREKAKTVAKYRKKLAVGFECSPIQILKYGGSSSTKSKLKCKFGHTWWATLVQCYSNKNGCPHCYHTKAKGYYYATHFKKYQLGSRVVNVQGYEPQVLDWLIDKKNINPNRITVSSEKKIPIIEFEQHSKKRCHYPDIMVIRANKPNIIVEVKSTWTFGCYDKHFFNANQRRYRTAIAQGYDYRILVWQGNKPMKLPKGWETMKFGTFTDKMKIGFEHQAA